MFTVKGEPGSEALDRFLSGAARCRIPAFVALGRKIRRHRPAIEATLEHDLSNALIALAMLSLDGFRPPLPGRAAT